MKEQKITVVFRLAHSLKNLLGLSFLDMFKGKLGYKRFHVEKFIILIKVGIFGYFLTGYFVLYFHLKMHIPRNVMFSLNYRKWHFLLFKHLLLVFFNHLSVVLILPTSSLCNKKYFQISNKTYEWWGEWLRKEIMSKLFELFMFGVRELFLLLFSSDTVKLNLWSYHVYSDICPTLFYLFGCAG